MQWGMDFGLESSAAAPGFYHTAPGSDPPPAPRSECHSFGTSVSSAGWTRVPADPPVPRPRSPSSLYAKALLGLRAGASGAARRRREFTPDEQKDSSYWLKRRRNNEAARRSRQRRRMDELFLEKRAVELLRENEKLKATLCAVQLRFVDAGNGPPVSAEGSSPRGFAARRVHPPAATRCPPQPPEPWMPPCGVSHAVFHDPFATYVDPTRSALDSFCVLPVSAAPVAARASPSVPPAASAPLRGAQYPREPLTCAGVGVRGFRVRIGRPEASGAQRGAFRDRETNMDDAQSRDEDAPSGHRVARNPARRAPPASASEFSPPHGPREHNEVHILTSRPKPNSSQNDGGNKGDAVVMETAAPCLPYKLRFKAGGCKRYQDFHLPPSARGETSTGGGVETKSASSVEDGREAAHRGRQ
ncbi:nuclear factor interleukin-3-regulated protein isoform X2 [Arapaima gigas]